MSSVDRFVLVGWLARRLAVSKRLSVWHFLVAIALLPTLGLPVLAGEVARDRLVEASTAARVERELLAVEALDRLRGAITTEAVSGFLTLLSGRFRQPLAVISGQLGLQVRSPAEAWTASDAALAAVPRIGHFTADVVGIGPELSRLRTALGAATADPRGGMASLTATGAAYQRLIDMVSDAEQSLVRRVGIGAEGVTSSQLLVRTRSLDAASSAVMSGATRAGLFYRILLAVAPSPSDVDQLAWESTRYRVLAAQLRTELDQHSLQAWDRATADEQFRVFDAAATKGPTAIPGLFTATAGAPVDPSVLVHALPTARAAMHVVNQLSTFLQQQAQETAAIARAVAAAARQRALVSLAGAGLVIAFTMIVLFVIGGMLRGRLNLLAEGAQRLSNGHLEPVALQGPRELAATGEALNAAVASLRHVEVKAGILASGDLNSPELEQPAPGPLGAAVHASVLRIVAAVREREELQRQLAHQASHDVLTGLPNRAELDRALHAALGRAERSAGPVSVLFVDLDGFKACNDEFGHAAGDHVLRVTADRLRDAVRPGDVAGRLGGDEFVAVLEGASPGPDTYAIGERIIAAVSQPVDYQGRKIRIGASVGLAGCDRGQAIPDQLLSEADAAVYHAKASGRGCVVVHDRNLHATLHAHGELQARVRHALDHGEFILHYQPVVDLAAMRMSGVEALIRWQRPGAGLLLPGDFIPALENGDLILDVDRWVLHHATAQLARWSQNEAMMGVRIWVNISGRHLANRSIVQDVRAALDSSGLAASRLVIEITESVRIDNPQAVENLRLLSALGVRIALDDFGTGHTSISQLLHLPINVIKLDRSLINGLSSPTGTAHGSRPICELVIEMAHSLGVTVVAEGIESPKHMAALLASQCDHGQGYLLTPPLEAAQVPAWTVPAVGRHRAPAAIDH